MGEENDRLARMMTSPVVCAGGFILRKREWAERGGDECLNKPCPRPDTCEIRNREQKVSENK